MAAFDGGKVSSGAGALLLGRADAAIERRFVEPFLEAHAAASDQIVIDLDATDDPLHGHEEGRFFHGYYDGAAIFRCTCLRRAPAGGEAALREP